MLYTLTADRASAVRAAVKRVALRQLAEGGPGAVAINAIARELDRCVVLEEVPGAG